MGGWVGGMVSGWRIDIAKREGGWMPDRLVGGWMSW